MAGMRRVFARAVAALLVAVAAWNDVRAGDDESTTPITRVVKVVRAEDGTPFAGADVEAYGVPGGLVAKRTGVDGTVRFANVPRKDVTFVARAAGRACDWHEPGTWSWVRSPEDDDPDGDGVTTITLELVRGATLEGRVMSTDGAPIAGAALSAREDAAATDVLHLAVAPIWTAATDASGNFRTDRHRPNGAKARHVSVRITAFAPGWISETLDAATAPVEFRLRPAAKLRGTVRNPDGSAAVGVDVHAYPSDFGLFAPSPDDARHDEDEHPRVLHVRTDAQGRYEMAELHPGTKFFVYAERRAPREGDRLADDAIARSELVPDVAVARAGEETVRHLALRGLGSLVLHLEAGSVTDGKDFDVTLSAPAGSLPHFDSDATADGRRWNGLLAGWYSMRIAGNDWASEVHRVFVVDGEETETVVRLSRGESVSGLVVDDRGVPVSGAVVHDSGLRSVDAGYRFAKTDAQGQFRIQGFAGWPVWLSAGAPGHESASGIRVDGPKSPIRLVLVREPRISLQVVAPDGGARPEKLRVLVTDVEGRYAGMQDERIVPVADLPATLDGLRPGPADVTVDVPGWAPSTVRVDLRPGETLAAGPFRFEPGVDLVGRVVDATGRPIAAARVRPYENAAREVVTGGDGRFVLAHLGAGTADLLVTAEGFPETRLVASTGVPAEIALRRGGVATGVVKSLRGRAARTRRYFIFEASAPSGSVPHWHVQTDETSHFTIRLPAGRYRFAPSRYDLADAVLFEVTEGGTTTVESFER
jgi:carboxypeptidase family protein